jgi:hypothetical protein
MPCINCPPEIQSRRDRGEKSAAFYQLCKKYILSLGIPNVLLTTSEKLRALERVHSYSDFVAVAFSGETIFYTHNSLACIPLEQ